VLFVVDASDRDAIAGVEADLAALPTDAPCTLVFNKVDLAGLEPCIESDGSGASAAMNAAAARCDVDADPTGPDVVGSADSGTRSGGAMDITQQPVRVYLSATTGAGLDLLRQHLKDCVGFHSAGSGALSARARHLDALRRARAHVEEAHRLLVERHAGELVAQELTDAQKALGEITGEVKSEDLLGHIFASFCIGK
jgi:tRNA U34 5-carboxymethylaminomethyl modifying GTPase MnmE/TrmE